MVLTNLQSHDLAVAKQLYLERLKLGMTMQAQAMLRRYVAKLLRELGPQLLAIDYSSVSQTKINALLKEFRAWNRKAAEEFRRQLLAMLALFAEEEYALQAQIWGAGVPTKEESSALFLALMNRPIGDTGLTLAVTIDRYLSAISDGVSKSLLGAFALKGTSADVARNLKALSKTKAGALNTLVRTAVQSVSGSAFANALGKGLWYVWISILDSRTSDICRSLSRRVFQVGKGPLPPAHANCRSTVAPYEPEEGPPPESTLGEFLRRQSPELRKDLTSSSPLTIDKYKRKVRNYGT